MVRVALAAAVALETPPLQIARGQRVALLGRNGVGKTTVLRQMAGLCGGAYTLAPVGYVCQNYRASLLPWFSVRRNLMLGGSRGEGELLAVAESVGLSPALLDRRPHRLSGGEQQLVALARALLARPKLLLLDEPFSALDAPTRLRLRRTLGEALPAGTTLVLTTHEIDDAFALCDRAVVLAGGPLRIAADLPLGGAEARGHIDRLLGDAL